MRNETKCSCGDPQQADVYISGVIGRGTAETGIETEELRQFKCSRHALTRKQYSAMLRKVTDVDTAFYGPWKVLEFHRHKLEKIGSKTVVDLTKGGKS